MRASAAPCPLDAVCVFETVVMGTDVRVGYVVASAAHCDDCD